MKSSHLPALVLGATLSCLALASSAQSPRKAPPPSGLTPGQTEERIKQLEARADAAEKAAVGAAMEKDYITRVQRQYESYYEKAFNTTMTVFGSIGLIIAVISIAAASLSLKFFDHRVQAAVAKVQDDVTATVKIELDNLRKENAAQIKELESALIAKITQLDKDLIARSHFLFLVSQGQIAGVAKRFVDAINSFRRALQVYKDCKPRQLFQISDGTRTVWNIFFGLKQEYPDSFDEKAKKELANPLYNDLDEELASAALEAPWLAPLIKERKPNPQTPPAPPPPPQS